MRIVTTLVFVVLLLVEAAAQSGNATWLLWARANHHPIASVQSSADDTFADLQFLKTTLKDRRIVQLGESGHGVAEFNHAKVRLIKFLHEQMGFEIMAFESGLFECYHANLNLSSTPTATMRNCIFGVWHTQEVLPLFDYIKARQASDRPLTLAGFDSQMSSALGVTGRPAFFLDLARVTDPQRAAAVQTNDQEFIQGVRASGASYAVGHEPRLTAFYGDLELSSASTAIACIRPPALHAQWWRNAPHGRCSATSSNCGRACRPPKIRQAWRAVRAIRDFAMADNLTFLANDLYPGRKIIVWAHNFHIRHDNAATSSRQPTMGQWIRERFRDELYTVGLYMDTGTAAQNDRVVYPINRSRSNSMEWVMANAGPAALFMDFLHQSASDGNRWMFQPTFQRDWGTNGFTMVPREQYDGVLFIDSVKSPAYLSF